MTTRKRDATIQLLQIYATSIINDTQRNHHFELHLKFFTLAMLRFVSIHFSFLHINN